MSGRVHAEAQAATKSSFVPVRTGLLAGYRGKQLVSQPPLIQAKLTINQPGDRYEQEADRVADAVMRMPEPGVQRQVEPEEEEETEGLPSIPEFRLTPPSLLGPDQPRPRLRLDVPTPDALRLVGLQLDPTLIRPALLQIDPGLLTPPSPTTTGAVLEPVETLPSESTPLVPAGPGPETPREASGSDIVRAVMAVPAVDTALTNLRTRALERVERDWGRLSTGEQIATIATTAIIGGGALAGVLSHPDTRQAAFDLLNGQTFPVPGVEGLQFEVGIRGNDWTVGFHLDVGALLPASLGFGPSSPSAFGPPPIPEGGSESESGTAVQRQIEEPQVQQRIEEGEEEVLHARDLLDQTPEVTPNIEARINAIRGGGQPLPGSTWAFFEPRFGQDFSQVRLHTDARAADAARAVNARAFTVGRDVVFGVGQYAPETTPGGRLLAHELTHVVQQGMSSSAAKIQRVIEGDITQMSITEDWARQLNDAELEEQIEIVRDQLPSLNSGSPEFETASSNLQILEQEVYIPEAEIRPIMSSSAAKIQRVIEGDITQMSITEDWARQLNDAELEEQIEIVRDQLPSLNSGSPEFETASSNLQILEQEVYIPEAEIRPIIEYILEEMLNNAASADVQRMHELNSVTMKGCIQEWQDLPLLGQLLGGPEECAGRVFASKSGAMVVWATNVRQGGSWDHKPHIGPTWGYWHRIGEYDYYYDIWSNIHYGYVGTAAGFSESALLDGAGAEQIGSTLARFQLPRASEDVEGLRAFDDPSDRASISIGIRLYETGATFQSILIAVLGNDVLSRRPVSP